MGFSGGSVRILEPPCVLEHVAAPRVVVRKKGGKPIYAATSDQCRFITQDPELANGRIVLAREQKKCPQLQPRNPVARSHRGVAPRGFESGRILFESHELHDV